MNRIITLILSITLFIPIHAEEVSVQSPDGNLQVTISDAGGRLYYSATLGGQQMLLPSALGLKTSIGDFTRDLVINNYELKIKNYDYKMRGATASSV